MKNLISLWVFLSITLGLLGCGRPPSTTSEEVFYSQNEEALYGLTALASGHKGFPCEKMFAFYDTAPAIYHGTMWQSFGNEKDCWKRIFADPKQVFIQFYLSNEVCRKKSNCAPYEFFPSLSVEEYNRALESADPEVLEVLREALIEILEFCIEAKKEGDECFVSFGLESQFTPEAHYYLTQLALKAGWRHEQIVHNPLDDRGPFSGYIIESHNRLLPTGEYPPARTIHTFDGLYTDLCTVELGSNSDRVSREELRGISDLLRDKARFIGFWCPEWQGLTSDSTTAPMPRDRLPSISPDSLDGFRGIAGYLT